MNRKKFFKNTIEFCKKCIHYRGGTVKGGVYGHDGKCCYHEKAHVCVNCFPLNCEGMHWKEV